MIDKQRERICREYRKVLEGYSKDQGKNARKMALLFIRQRYQTPERTLYRWCAAFGIETR